MPLVPAQIRPFLNDFDFRGLFVEQLGWDNFRSSMEVEVDRHTFHLTPIAEKRQMVAFQCSPDADGTAPDYATRRKIERRVAKTYFEHLIVFIDKAMTTQIWQWVKREPGR